MSSKKHLDVVAALISKQGKVLLCQRRADDVFALLWEFPGGTVEPGETKQQALRREIKEELGIVIEVGALIETFDDSTDNIRIRDWLFSVKDTAGVMAGHECHDFGFFNREEIAELPLAPVDRKIFNYLKSMPVT
jgi:8-oxo-dGTP diphosphatase